MTQLAPEIETDVLVSHRHVLVTTVHDPDQRLLPGLMAQRGRLSACEASYAFVTEPTDPQVIDTLHEAGVRIEVGPGGSAGAGQRRALDAAVRDEHHNLFVCDFDRWLHWAASYPRELADLPDRVDREHANAWYICLGRTDRAFATHPAAQSLPEEMTNRALSIVVGRRLDATAGASWLRSDAAHLILADSTADSKATDLEWPGLVLVKERSRVQGAFLEGLEFETADAYPMEIERLGSMEAWVHETYDQPKVLRDRLQLAADSISALMRVVGIE